MRVRTPDPPCLPKHVPAKNAPDFTLPNKDTPKTHPILDPNLWRGTFWGVYNTPLHGYMQNLASFRPKPSARDISGRMLLRPTRVHAKFGGFHIPAPGYTKNAPGFIFPHPDTPKTRPILDANPCRRIFGGVCFCAPTRICKKFGGFHISALDMAQNPAGFGLCHTTWRKTRRVLDSATRHSAKPDGFWTLPHDMARNPAGFGLCHTTWHETRQVLDFATRHSAKPGGFWTLPHDMTRNPAGFSHCHTFE